MADTVFDQIISIAMPYASRAASGDTESGGEIIEALATALGRVVGRVSGGDHSTIDTVCMGLEQHVHREAMYVSELTNFVKNIRKPAR